METLHNELLTVEVSDLGAELQSIKDDEGKEYLWQGDDRYWGRRSPILFPIVCGLWKGTYRTEGDTYQMGRHGFARDMNFRVLKKADDRVTYVLSDTEATLRQYPYRFMLSVTYKLVENEIHVIWHVHNTDTREIHFQIGAHPAFNLTVVFGEPISRIDRSVFEDVATWGVCSLQGWVNSYESVRFVAIDDHTAIITGEYNMEQVKVWLEKYTSIKSLKTS